MGWSVVDEPDGWRLEPIGRPAADVLRPIRAHDVGSVLDEPATADVSIHWVVEGWPLDVRRAIDSFRANAGSRDVHYVVADVTRRAGYDLGRRRRGRLLEPGTGWGAARNAGLKRSRGRIVLAMDGSVEATGDVLGPLEAALADPTVGVCGPFGIVTPDLREFDATDGPEADAIEGYCMAFRREILTDGRPVRREVPLVPDGGHRVLVPDQGSGAPGGGRSRSGGASRASDVVPDAARGSREVVQAELLPVPGSVARPVRPHRVRGATAGSRPRPSRAPRSRRARSVV